MYQILSILINQHIDSPPLSLITESPDCPNHLGEVQDETKSDNAWDLLLSSYRSSLTKEHIEFGTKLSNLIKSYSEQKDTTQDSEEAEEATVRDLTSISTQAFDKKEISLQVERISDDLSSAILSWESALELLNLTLRPHDKDGCYPTVPLKLLPTTFQD